MKEEIIQILKRIETLVQSNNENIKILLEELLGETKSLREQLSNTRQEIINSFERRLDTLLNIMRLTINNPNNKRKFFDYNNPYFIIFILILALLFLLLSMAGIHIDDFLKLLRILL
jgi:DNA replicative helicase MCM subunit Mcm2 (Cdc46/Mcm family)